MKPAYQDNYVTIYQGDARKVLEQLPDNSVNCCVTSPPYYQIRDYKVAGQMGLEPTLTEYMERLLIVLDQVRRVLRDDGTLWLNLGDSYSASGKPSSHSNLKALSDKWAPRKNKRQKNRYEDQDIGRPTKRIPEGLKAKDLIGVPWRIAFALQDAGWYLRQDIIWHKPNPMPESVTDRCSCAHEYIFLLTKSGQYYYDASAIKEKLAPAAKSTYGTKRKPSGGGPLVRSDNWGRGTQTRKPKYWPDGHTGANKKSVWTVATVPYHNAHFAVFPEKLIIPCILAGCPKDGVVLDPFGGSGTVAAMAKKYNRRAISIDLKADYIQLQKDRIKQEVLPL